MGSVLPDLREGSVVDVEAAYFGRPVVHEAPDETVHVCARSEAVPWSLRTRAGVPRNWDLVVGGARHLDDAAAWRAAGAGAYQRS